MSSSEMTAESSMEVERPAVKISFGVKKRIESQVILRDHSSKVPVLDVVDNSDEEREAEEEERAAKRRKLTHFENGTMPEDEVDAKKKTKLVIPMVTEVDWRVQKLLEQEKDGSISEADRARLALLTENNPSFAQEKDEGEAIVVDVEGKEAADADYSQVSVESFGLAVLRGCGWKDGEGIGKNPQVVPLRLPERRPKGLGLGAAPKNERKGGKGKDGDSEDGVSQEIKCGSFIKITQGIHKGAYAKVESRDDDNSSLLARLAIRGVVVRVSLFAAYAVSQKKFERDGKCINKDEYEKEKRRIEKEKARGERRSPKNGSDVQEIERKEFAYDDRRTNDDEMWARVDLIVRVVTKDYKKGRHLDEKMRVVDAADRKNITLEDSRGSQHYNIRQSWIETVIPRERGESVMIVRGKGRGEKAVMEEKDKRRSILYARILSTQEMIKVEFDDVCSWQPRVIEEDDM